MIWIVALLTLLVLGAAILRFTRGVTIYFSHSNGFIAFGGGSERELQPAPRERYERILQRYVRGDLFDSLWISHRDGDQSGIVLSREGGETEIDVGFLPLREEARLAVFRGQMEAWGYPPSEESLGNVGLGPDEETLTLSYRVPTEPVSLLDLVDRVLIHLNGEREGPMYVSAWNSGDVPTANGIHLRRERDLIGQIP